MSPPRVALAQMEMSWTVDENLGRIAHYLEVAAAAGASVVQFPELALSGYHMKLPAMIERGTLERGLRELSGLCRAAGVAALVGAPVLPHDRDDVILNALFAIDRSGDRLACIPKSGLTDGEKNLFTPGSERPHFELEGSLCTALLCREVFDADAIEGEVSADASIVFWPGLMRHRAEATADAPAMKRASPLARRLGADLYHTNWPAIIGQPEERDLGRSCWLDPTGAIKAEAPADAPGVLFTWRTGPEAWLAL